MRFVIISILILRGVEVMQRTSGVLMHISSLWGDYSIGSFGKSAREWVDFLCDCGFRVWQVLPFCLPDFCNSPYKSFSAFSINPFFIDLEELYSDGLITKEELDNAKQTTPYSCEFEKLKNERFNLLKTASKRFTKSDEIEKFLKANTHTEKFCEFMALKKANDDKAWNEWRVNEADKEELELWYFMEYQAYTQWKKIKEYANEKGISVIGDIPIYVDYDSSDVWSNPSQFLLDEDNKPSCVAGVPPDYFCADGQLWGNPIYDWEEMKKDGYNWWCDRIKFMSSMFDGVRIDHFRGIESYYTVAAGEDTARNGEWKKGPGMELINAFKNVCGDCILIAEDLGDITDDVRKLVKNSGLPGMRVLQFGFLGDFNSPHLPHNYINNCVAYTGTHDNNTLLGYIWELDDETRKKVLAYCGFEGENWDKCYDEILRMMFASHAGLLILPLQDLLLYGSDTRINTPGKSDGNWGFRITKEQIDCVDRNKFRKWNEIYGRK